GLLPEGLALARRGVVPEGHCDVAALVTAIRVARTAGGDSQGAHRQDERRSRQISRPHQYVLSAECAVESAGSSDPQSAVPIRAIAVGPYVHRGTGAVRGVDSAGSMPGSPRP